MKNQFRDRRTDFDMREQIRCRRQRIGEKFDAYNDSILQITNRFQTAISEFELLEIIKRNLKPEIRKELLHFSINSIANLREFVRKHEILEEQLEFRRTNKTFTSRKTVSEIVNDNTEESVVQVE